MIILGIDPGIADTGWGVVEATSGNKMKCLNYGSIKTSASLELPERLLLLFEALEKIIIDYKPVAVGIEDLFFCNNAKTALVVGQARGVALLALKKAGLPIFHYTPLQVKQAVTGSGSADKKQVQKMVKMILGLEQVPKPDDAADALAIAICAEGPARNFLRLS